MFTNSLPLDLRMCAQLTVYRFKTNLLNLTFNQNSFLYVMAYTLLIVVLDYITLSYWTTLYSEHL